MSALLMLIFLEIVYYHLPLAKKKSHCLLYSTEINCKFGFHFFANY